MLHEILLPLLGYTGDLIIDKREYQNSLGIHLSPDSPISDKCTFKLAPDLSFIQPSDRELDRFATKSRNLSWIRSTTESPLSRTSELLKGKSENSSVYRRAIANGIVEVISLYQSAVLQIEQKLLAESDPILTTVTDGLNKFSVHNLGALADDLLYPLCLSTSKVMISTFFVLLPPLYELILEIERDDIRGRQFLNLLHKRCHCGMPELQTCIQRLLWHGHQVLYNQLASWMVYGILQDPHGDFFIRRQEGRDAEQESPHPDVPEKLASLLIDDATLTDWQLGFHIFLDMLPEYIPMRVAESILFAGKAVRVLRNPSPAFRNQDTMYYQQLRGSQKIQGFLKRLSIQKEPSVNIKCVGEELLPQSQADEIKALLQELKSSEFHRRSFESSGDSIWAIAASHLWQLVVVRADLNGHLRALKDYFLLAKGDFFQCFLEESRQLMRLPPRQSTAEADLMVPFQLAALKTIGDEDRYFSRVSLRMPSFGITAKSSHVDLPKAKAYSDESSGAVSSNASSEMSLDGWDGIALEYSVDWPLQLFFTKEVLSKYLRIFQYLLWLKRTQMELEKSWASVMHQDHADFAKYRNDRTKFSASQLRRQCFSPMWRVREHMAFLIRNLQFYIQSRNGMCCKLIFKTFMILLNLYLSALISQSFLDIGSVSRILDGIMKLCLQFCWNIENQESSLNTSELERIIEEFNKKSNSLYTILRSSKLAGSQRAPFLRQFLLRMNYNSFFENLDKVELVLSLNWRVQHFACAT
ncbi:Gamma tubulin complex component protein, N-terminal [Dillenia turbinata]|uniref:Gamma-tubulin complex component n=1 Tax=Dillenia turbinata TaxID=194707 RepID=A0AAN8W874_9MAGN